MSIQQQLQQELVNTALNDFNQFCETTGIDLRRAYICMLKAKGKSYAQIAVCLGITRKAVIGIYQRNCTCVRVQNKVSK